MWHPHVELYIGPMWSGKTSTMCNRVERYHHAGKNCIIVKYQHDTRYNHLSKSGGIVNHRGDEYSKVKTVLSASLQNVDVAADIANIDVIGVDEGQFYQDAPEIISKWVSSGKIVIISALDTTYQAKPFGRVPELVSISDTVQKLSAVCMKCGNDAIFTAKISGESTIEDVGSADKYIAVCRKCFTEYRGC
jgi:thymidine kinase